MSTDAVWRAQAEAFGSYLRAQRKVAELSLRDLAAKAEVSNAYLSQLERGLHRPSLRILNALANALVIPPERLLARASAFDADRPDESPDIEAAIRADERLTDVQKKALISTYRSYLEP